MDRGKIISCCMCGGFFIDKKLELIELDFAGRKKHEYICINCKPKLREVSFLKMYDQADPDDYESHQMR